MTEQSVPSDGERSPVVSIGLPVRNGATYLDQAIRSILEQDFADFELIVCDNASDDGTAAICAAHAARDGRIRVVTQRSNVGAAENYNSTFRLARGRYFKWAAHDDVLGPGFLRACVGALDADPGLVLVQAETVVINADGQQIEPYSDNMYSNNADPIGRFAQWMLRGGAQCNPVFGVMRREVMATTALHGDYASADRVLLAEMALRGRSRQMEGTTFLRRVHPDMSTRSNAGAHALAQWFKGQPGEGLYFRRYRLIAEFARAIGRARLSPMRSFRAYLVLAAWVARNAWGLAYELMLPLYMNGEPTRLNLWLRGVLGIKVRPEHRRSARPDQADPRSASGIRPDRP